MRGDLPKTRYTSGMKKYRLAAYTVGLLLVPAMAYAAVSVTATPPYPGTTINAGTRVSFSVIATGFSSPVYTVIDSFGGGANNSHIDSTGSFFYSTNASDIGTHTITVTVNDSAGNTGSVAQTVTVNAGPTANLQAATSTAVIGNQILFTAASQGLFNPTYTASDSFANSSLRAAVNADGTFVWTPLWQDIGTHTITITAKDSLGYSTTASQTITVISGMPAAAVPTAGSTNSSQAAPATTASTTAPVAQPVAHANNSYVFTKYLAVGSTGAEVTALQKILISSGYLGGSATGYFGVLTKRAVMAYQSAHGVQALGVVGPATRALLNRRK